MSSPYSPVDRTALLNAPDIVEELTHWSSLLGLELNVQRDNRDGAWLIVIFWQNAPDLLLEFDVKGRFLTFYSNILTEFDPEGPKDDFYYFLLDLLNRQSYYQSVRFCAGKSKETQKYMIKIYSKYRSTALSMQQLSILIMDAKRFLNDIQRLIVEYKLPEIWRHVEGEPSKGKYDADFQYR